MYHTADDSAQDLPHDQHIELNNAVTMAKSLGMQQAGHIFTQNPLTSKFTMVFNEQSRIYTGSKPEDSFHISL
jgi:hypothetical protein